jgi:hypothetical protein
MIMRESFDEILPPVLALAKDSVPFVREAVGLCLAMFSENLPQSVLARDAILLPVVFTMLEDTDPYVVEKTYVRVGVGWCLHACADACCVLAPCVCAAHKSWIASAKHLNLDMLLATCSLSWRSYLC